MKPRRIIWLTIFSLMSIAYGAGTLTFGGWCLLLFIGLVLARMFDPPVQKTKTEPVQETEIEEDLPVDDVLRIRRRAVEQIRNSLLRHHNSRGTDADYQSSAAAKETTAIIQVLNGALAKKQRRLSAPPS